MIQSEQARQEPERPKSRKKLSVYKKALLIYSAVLLVLFAAFQVFSWTYLNSYQKGLCEDSALRYVSSLSDDEWLGILEGSVYGSVFQTKRESAQQACALLKGGDFSVRRSPSESKGGTNVFKVRNGTAAVCSLTLVKSGTRAYNRPKWTVTELKMDEDFLNSVNPQITVLLPSEAVLTLDGKELQKAEEEAVASPFATGFESDEKLFRRCNFRAPCCPFSLSAQKDGECLEKKDIGENSFAFDLPDEKKVDITISVPVGAETYVNGTRLTTDYISARNAAYPFISPLELNRPDAPKSTEYSVGGLYRVPELRVVYGGEELVPEKSTDGAYLFPFSAKGTDYRLTVPSDAVVTVNGTNVTDDNRFITADNIEYSEVSRYRKELVNPKICRVYEFGNLYLKPEILVTDAEGKDCPLTQTENCSYSCNLPPMAGGIAQYDGLSKDFGVAMMEYMFLGRDYLNEGFKKALSFVRPNSDASKVIQDSYYGMYWRRTHTIEYSSMYTDNYISYADNSFRCDLHYDVTGTVVNTGRIDHVVGIYRLLYIKGNGGWKIAELHLLKDEPHTGS